MVLAVLKFISKTFQITFYVIEHAGGLIGNYKDGNLNVCNAFTLNKKAGTE